MFKRPGSTKSIGKNDWVFLCADSEEIAVQSIFLSPLTKRPLAFEKRSDGMKIVALDVRPHKKTVELLMDWALHEGRLQGITAEEASELLWIAEALGFTGLVDACDCWFESKARSGKLFGSTLQSQEHSTRIELTREYWDAFANCHNLRRLAACCEASVDSSPQDYKRRPRDVMRRLADVSWASNASHNRISLDA